MATRVALVFGYGANIGNSVAAAFAAKGYKVAIVSRSGKSTHNDYLSIRADLSDPTSVEPVFSEVVDKLGYPSVVVYNPSANSVKASDSISQQVSSLQSDNNVNIVSPYIAARLAAQSFAQLPSDAARTFIYTGNKLNFVIIRPLLGLGVGKSGGSHVVRYFADEFKEQGFKFYYADERTGDGSAVYSAIDGPAHADFYAHLADAARGPWLATFVKGKGYVKFDDEVI
ncbi:NAD(P)-binding domain protein [Moelleriella libera RCEF 2490]|uniref:NAD(P)-binding domain protein n=1 Tax=Moelleriella libera RCEF 2490 TaxID=1081109 RepID=A0A168EA94_9HYPO|nr:NAD(P)-binding domain protein [Moelleriella libera RCEF 2490]